MSNIRSAFSIPVGAAALYCARVQGGAVASGVWSEQVIFSGLLVLIGLAAVPFGAIEPWWEGIFEGAIFMLGACYIGTETLGMRWRIPSVLVPIIGFLVLAGLQTLPLWHTNFISNVVPGISRTISLDPFETKRFVIKLLAIALALAMLLRYTSNRKRLLALAHLVIIVGAASAGFAIWRRLLPATALDSLWNNKLQSGSFGQFMNRNHFAVLMEMSLGAALGLASYAGHGFKRRHLYAATAFFICVALVLANSRGGIISMLGQLGFMAWIYFSPVFDGSSLKQDAYGPNLGPRRFWRGSRMLALRCVLILLLLGTAFSSVLWLGGEPVRHRLESVPGEFLVRRGDVENASPRRLEIWGATWRLIEAHPLLGSGFGAYKTAITEYFSAYNDWRPQQAHNEYLELVAGGGIVGAALGVWFVVVLFREARKRLYEGDALRRAACLGALVGLVGVAIHSLVDFGLHVMVNALVCCTLIALATAKVRSASLESHSPVN